MTKREMYLGMADWFRGHGFTPHLVDSSGCGCFLFARSRTLEREPIKFDYNELRDVVGSGFEHHALQRYGWIDGCTDDAIAACEIAADLAA